MTQFHCTLSTMLICNSEHNESLISLIKIDHNIWLTSHNLKKGCDLLSQLENMGDLSLTSKSHDDYHIILSTSQIYQFERGITTRKISNLQYHI